MFNNFNSKTPSIDNLYEIPTDSEWNPYLAVPGLLGMAAAGYYGFNYLGKPKDQSLEIFSSIFSTTGAVACGMVGLFGGMATGYAAQQLIENTAQTINDIVAVGIGASLGAHYGFNYLGKADEQSLYICNGLCSTAGAVVCGMAGLVASELIGNSLQYLNTTMDNL